MLPNCGNLYKILKDCAYDSKTGEYFFSLEKILSYNKAWNFITGPRSCGKTTGVATFLLADVIKNNRPFLYIRRTKDELDLTKKKFFNDAIQILEDKAGIVIDSFEMVGNDYMMKLHGSDKTILAGTSFYLSKEEKLKSGGYHIYNIVYDEFIAQDSTAYLGTFDAPKEYEKALELYTSMDRGIGTPYRNEVRFFFLGNTATIYNPIFVELNIVKYIQPTSKIISPKNEAWLVQQLGLDDIKVLQSYQDSFVYKLSSDVQKDYNFNNKGRDTDTFIEPKPDNARPLYNFIVDKKHYGVYTNNEIIYISKAQHAQNVGSFALDIQSHDGIVDREFIHRYAGNDYVKQLSIAFKMGRLRFENGEIKSIFVKYFGFMPS